MSSPTPDIIFKSQWLDHERATELMKQLCHLPFHDEYLVMFGKRHRVPRKVLWVGDPEAAYRYSGRDHQPNPWPPPLQELRSELAKREGLNFNGVLANFYRHGEDYMGWHADNEKELGSNPTIASLNFGVPRRFLLRHRESGD